MIKSGARANMLTKYETAKTLAKVAAEAPQALLLAIQLLAPACKNCNYHKPHCRCHDEGKGQQ